MFVWMMFTCAHVVWVALHSLYEQVHDLVASLADNVVAAAPDCFWDTDLRWLLNASSDYRYGCKHPWTWMIMT